MRSAAAWLLLLLPASLAERSLHYPFDTSRRALQHGARDANICANIDNEGIGRTKLVAHTGTLSDDQQGKVNCAKGGCGGRDPEGGKNKNGYSDNLDCGQIIHAPAGYTINLRFTYMALETSKTCKKPGCDTVTVYDGPSVHSRVLGVFSGLRNPPPIKSTGTDIFIRFQTDVGNYGFQQGHVNKDPGFYVDWHFVKHVSAGANKGATGDSFDGSQVGGVGICPAKSILTDAHGVIHDDEVGNTDCSKTNTCGSKGGQGYADNLNCYTTIHAPKGETIEFTFTQMNLEGPGQKPGCSPCTDKRGCDWVEIYDGKDNHAKLIGTYSGHHLGWIKGEDQLPAIESTGQDMHIRFRTDNHNCGIDSSEDPGFIAEWRFIENGVNICHPSGGALRNHHGVLHDDAVGNTHCDKPGDCGGADPKGGANKNGYSDNLDCGVRLHAPRGYTINVHFTQMNIEGVGAGGLCDHDIPPLKKIDCTHGGDFVTIYDGNNKNKKVIAKVTGDITDSRIHSDSFTSSGRDMFVRFTTDKGNYGLTGSTDEPGFWLEWEFVKNGQACQSFTSIANTGIVGHNNENFPNKLVTQCEKLCCARSWCRSFDFVPGANKRGTCALADVDITHNGATSAKWGGSVYEKPALPAPTPIMGPSDCARQLSRISNKINSECCPAGGCRHGPPDHCSDECDQVWSPFQKQCTVWIEKTLGKTYAKLSQLCERQEYGRYHVGSNHGRCGSGDVQQWIEQLGPACCGKGQPGSSSSEHCKGTPNAAGFILPTQNGQRNSPYYCPDECARLYDEMYAECNPWLKAKGLESVAKAFLGTCQKVSGGRHRRLATGTGTEEDVGTMLASRIEEQVDESILA